MSDLGIAVAEFVILVDDASAVVGEVGLHELLLFEEIKEVAVFVGLLHCPLDAAVGEHFIAIDIYFVDLHLILAVDREGEDFLILFAEVGLADYLHLCIFEALGRIVILDDLGHAGDDVGRELLSGHHAEAFGEILFLAASHTFESQFGHAWLLAQRDIEPHLIAHHLLDRDLHLRV